MRREISGWYSHRLGLDMPIVRYGSWGRPLLLFPTWASDFMEAEHRGLIHAIAHHIHAGRVTVFSVNSINPHAWMNPWMSTPHKAHMQAMYSEYVEEEVVPYIRNAVQDSHLRIAAGGASFGAFFAANALFRRPDLFDTLFGLSGAYHLGPYLHGYSDDRVYFNSPQWFVPGIPEGPTMDLLRQSHIHLLTGQGQWEYPWETEQFAAVLRSRGVPHWLDVWGHDAPHDWHTWQRMLEICVAHRPYW